MAETPTETTQSKPASIDDQLRDIREEMAEIPPINKDMAPEERREYREQANALSKKAVELRKQQLAAIKDPKERQVLQMYDEGHHQFAIALKVYDFANSDTVGAVTRIIRKHHADDFEEVEDVNSYKGYTGAPKE